MTEIKTRKKGRRVSTIANENKCKGKTTTVGE